MVGQLPSQPELHLEVQLPDGLAQELDEGLLRRLVERVLANEGFAGKVEISLVVTDDETMRQLNQTYRGIDRPTDVLSFPLQHNERKRGVPFVLPPGDMIHLGDVVISYPRAVAQAHEYGHSLEREVGYLSVHGVLHLLGYDHRTKVERDRMRAKAESALAGLAR